MAGLELLYNSVIDNIASPQDALLCFVHWEIIRNGYKCLGTGDQVRNDAFVLVTLVTRVTYNT